VHPLLVSVTKASRTKRADKNDTNNCHSAPSKRVIYHFLPVITRPTRVTTDSATFIDNLITNRPLKVIHSPILIKDLSDHLPLLMWIDSSPITHFATLSQSTRRIDLNSMDTFKNLINLIDWPPIHSLCDQNDPSAAYEACI